MILSRDEKTLFANNKTNNKTNAVLMWNVDSGEKIKEFESLYNSIQ